MQVNEVIGAIGIFFILALAIPVIMIFLGYLLRYNPKTHIRDDLKNMPYECGEQVYGDARTKVDIPYYKYAMIFVLFDIDIVFFYPIAVRFFKLDLLSYLGVVLFFAVLVISYFYLLKKGLFSWDI